MTYCITGLSPAPFAPLFAPGKCDAANGGLFAGDGIAYIHADDAAHGWFAARVDRT